MEPLVAIGVGILVFLIHHGTDLLALQVHDSDGSSVFQESYFLAVRTVLRLEGGLARFGQTLFLDFGRIRKLLFILLYQRSLVNLPQAIPLGSIDQTASVRRKVDIPFLLRRISNLFGRLVFHRSHIDISMYDEGNFVAIR